MLKQRLPIILFSLIAFLLSLVLTIPASQAYQWGILPDTVKLYGVSGRLFSGKANQVVINKIRINQVSWTWRPLSLLKGSLAIDWQLDGEQLNGKGSSSHSFFGGHEIEDALLMVNSKQLNSFLPRGNKLVGSIELDIKTATFSEELEAINAMASSDSLSVHSVLGEFNVNNLNLSALGTKTDGYKLRAIDSKNKANMDVLADIKQKNIILSGYIDAHSTVAKQLESLLPVIATKQGNKWIVSWQGIVPKI